MKSIAKIKLLTLVVSCFIAFSSLGFKILDPHVKNSFFFRLEELLDYEGIDIVQDWQSNVKLSGRPTLAPIANYQVSVLAKESEWTKSFSNYYSNALVAIETEQTVGATSFLDTWKSTSPEKRIFLSFTKDDLKSAEIIKSTLEYHGYQVFIYTASNRETFASPEMIVYCMKTAGEVLVLDTEVARSKEGVIAEALAYAKYSFKSQAELIEENKLLQAKVKEAFEKLDFNKNLSESIVTNTKTAYSENLNEQISEEKIKELYKKNYETKLESLNLNNEVNKISEQYLKSVLNNEYLTNSSYNVKLKENLSVLENVGSAGLFSLENVLEIWDYIAFCPYYKIPLKLCPICSRGFIGR